MTPDEDTVSREHIHHVLAEEGSKAIDRPAFLTGWTVVCEWQDSNGERWLSKSYSDSLARWHADGMLHEALYGNWPEDDEDDDPLI